MVALESTIITHGMPYPDNGAMAADVEKIIADGGAVPATIAVVGGRSRSGSPTASANRWRMTGDAMKLSRADLAFAVAQGRTGGTTVAATMIAAHIAGIKVFATGGIGGVHKGAEKSFDISADLDELARTPVIVVSAGAKAILDIEKTLEVLETRGVPVVGHGCETMPAFWSRQIGGSVALAFVGTIFAQSLTEDLPAQLTAAGVPDQVLTGFQSATSTGSFDFNQLLNVGGDLGASVHGRDPGGGQGLRRAIHPEHRERHLQRLQHGRRANLLAGRVWLSRGSRRGDRHQGDPASHHGWCTCCSGQAGDSHLAGGRLAAKKPPMPMRLIRPTSSSRPPVNP